MMYFSIVIVENPSFLFVISNSMDQLTNPPTYQPTNQPTKQPNELYNPPTKQPISFTMSDYLLF